METIDLFLKKRQDKKKKKLEKLREKNDLLRKQGKDPLKGWNKTIDTGTGGGNNVMMKTGKGLIDMTGKNDGVANYFSEEQKQLGQELERKRQYDKK